jgi:hypothetical protein
MQRGSGVLVPPADHDAARVRSQVDSAALFRVILARARSDNLTFAIPTLWNAYARRRYPHSGQFECEQSGSGLSAEVNEVMDSIIYLVGLIVVVMFILGALGLH